MDPRPPVPAPIARSWGGRCRDDEAADRYARHLAETVLPELERLDGHRGALLLRRALPGGGVEIRVLTLWTSVAAIDRFAGPDRARAVVEPPARAVLDDYDEHVEHFDVAIDTLDRSP